MLPGQRPKPSFPGVVATTACLLLAAAPAWSGAQQPAPPAEAQVVTAEAARFVPADPARPEGAAIAVLRGNPDTGPSDMLFRIRPGPGTLHVHSADYRLVVIEGVMKHLAAGETEADVPSLGPGSYWFQPGGVAHADTCLTETCLIFISWSGARDARVYEPAPAQPSGTPPG